MLDAIIYVIRYPCGIEEEYSENIIAQNLYSQCDLDGNQNMTLKHVVDHRVIPNAVRKGDEYFETANGTRRLRKSTRGWELCIEWMDGSTSWEKLSTLKESYPVQVAIYAKDKYIDSEPAFSWWTTRTLRKRDRIVSTIAARFMKRNYKFRIRIPRSIQEALEEDRMNGNTLWKDAIEREMNFFKFSFSILEPDAKDPVGHSLMRCYMIFDVKIENFQRKARFLAGGHMLDSPSSMTYSSVVSRESVRITHTIAALNYLQVISADIKNAYLTTLVSERIWTILGPEFGENKGRKAIIVRVLCGLHSAGASFRHHLADCIEQLGYKSCLEDLDLWIKKGVRPSDGFEYYSYVLLHVYDILAISHQARNDIELIKKYFPMKEDSIHEPSVYLGAKVKK